MNLCGLDIDHPIVLAPMAGGPSTPELVVAVSEAGGLGSHGVAYTSPDRIRDDVVKIRSLTDRPFCLNLFAGGYDAAQTVNPEPILEILGGIHREYGLPAPVVPARAPDPFPELLNAVLEARPTAFSFAFGVPTADQMRQLKRRGIVVLGTATTLDEAKILAQAGVDGVIAQGREAGGHRSTFDKPFEQSMVPTIDLCEGIARSIGLPVIASGGVMSGAGIREALSAGASAVQMGTAFLACPEAGTSEPYRRALLGAVEESTVITRAYSGRPARGLANDFSWLLADHPEAVLPFPFQNTLTRPMRTEAARRGDSERLSLWAGTGVTKLRPMPAGNLVDLLASELAASG